MNNSQLAHTWAQQRKPSGRGSSFYFEGPTIYSYGGHFPIATFTDKTDANGERIVLFTTRGYSNSTCKHINHTWRALQGLNVRVLNVKIPHHSSYADNIAENIADLVQSYDAEILAAAKARKYGASHIERAENMAGTLADYCRAFGADMPELQEITPELLATAKKRAQANAARFSKRPCSGIQPGKNLQNVRRKFKPILSRSFVMQKLCQVTSA